MHKWHPGMGVVCFSNAMHVALHDFGTSIWPCCPEGDGLNVSVLRADGKCCWMPLASLEPRDEGNEDHQIGVGSNVRHGNV